MKNETQQGAKAFLNIDEFQTKGWYLAASMLLFSILVAIFTSLSVGIIGALAAAAVFFMTEYSVAHLEAVDTSNRKSTLLVSAGNSLLALIATLMLIVVAVLAIF